MPKTDTVFKSYTSWTCRICLEANCKNMVALENDLLSLFEFCVGILVKPHDEPKMVCEKCSNNIKNYAKFKEQCQKSDYFWKNMVSEVTCYVQDYIPCKQSKIENNITNGLLVNSSDEKFKTEPFFVTLSNSDITENVLCPLASNHGLIDFNCKYTDCNTFDNDMIIEEGFSNDEKHNDLIQNKAATATKVIANKNNLKSNYNSITMKKRTIKPNKKNDLNYKTKKKYKNRKNDQKIPKKLMKICLDTKEETFLCGLCPFSAQNFNDVPLHLNEHWSINDLKCKLCNFVGLDLACFITHRYSHYRSDRKHRLYCHICQWRTLSLRALQFHYRSVHLDKLGGFCSICKRSFNSMSQWKKHDKTHGNGYICDHCGKRFSYKHLIAEHMTVHYDWVKNICETCGKSFKRVRHLKLHVRNVHGKSDPIKCEHCNRMFKSQFTFGIHQKLLAAARTLKCEVCHKKFATPNLLKSHMIWHSDERPFCCTICDARFKAKSYLKVHMKRHAGETPFSCGQCNRSFTCQTQLRRHMSVHTGIRAHKCAFCERSFHSKKQMQVHSSSCKKTSADVESSK